MGAANEIRSRDNKFRYGSRRHPALRFHGRSGLFGMCRCGLSSGHCLYDRGSLCRRRYEDSLSRNLLPYPSRDVLHHERLVSEFGRELYPIRQLGVELAYLVELDICPRPILGCGIAAKPSHQVSGLVRAAKLPCDISRIPRSKVREVRKSCDICILSRDGPSGRGFFGRDNHSF